MTRALGTLKRLDDDENSYLPRYFFISVCFSITDASRLCGASSWKTRARPSAKWHCRRAAPAGKAVKTRQYVLQKRRQYSLIVCWCGWLCCCCSVQEWLDVHFPALWLDHFLRGNGGSKKTSFAGSHTCTTFQFLHSVGASSSSSSMTKILPIITQQVSLKNAATSI